MGFSVTSTVQYSIAWGVSVQSIIPLAQIFQCPAYNPSGTDLSVFGLQSLWYRSISGLSIIPMVEIYRVPVYNPSGTDLSVSCL
jgi:hypothetical protein